MFGNNHSNNIVIVYWNFSCTTTRAKLYYKMSVVILFDFTRKNSFRRFKTFETAMKTFRTIIVFWEHTGRVGFCSNDCTSSSFTEFLIRMFSFKIFVLNMVLNSWLYRETSRIGNVTFGTGINHYYFNGINGFLPKHCFLHIMISIKLIKHRHDFNKIDKKSSWFQYYYYLFLNIFKTHLVKA